ncbi:hypothetical protein [Noviherbaspirillum sp. ST9]|uniref:hypothetical protein n=1 Tax=Noviherbaspirillum sp. ST9 TaxID=3401606 RepID=UPI003B58A56C
MGLYLAYDSDFQAARQGQEDPRPQLLLAVRPEDVAMSKGILGEEFNAVFCHSYAEACAQLKNDVRLVTCGVHFDNGRVFDLLRFVRENPRTANLPFFILLGAGSRYSPAIVQGIRAAAKLLKVTAFTDLTRFSDKLGTSASIDALRQGIRDAIAAQPPLDTSRSTVAG